MTDDAWEEVLVCPFVCLFDFVFSVELQGSVMLEGQLESVQDLDGAKSEENSSETKLSPLKKWHLTSDTIFK